MAAARTPRASDDLGRAWQESVIAHVVDAVILVGHGGRIEYFNRAAARIFRCPPEDALGSNVERFVPSRFRDAHREYISRGLGIGHSTEMAGRQPVPALRADGEEFFADIALVPLCVPGLGAASACIIRDISDRVRMEAAVRQSQKLESLRILSAGLAHDFNNILAVIFGNTDLALALIGDRSPAATALRDVREAAGRAADMVAQMLRFAGEVAEPYELVDVNHVVAEMVRLLKNSLGAGVSTAMNLDPSLAALRCDPTGLRQVLMNLVLNASDAIGEDGGTVTVATSEVTLTRQALAACVGAEGCRPGRFFCLEVSDTGTGMDAETRARIFDPFFSTKFAGRGLGLPSVLGIVRAHGGAIRVSSRPGRGTTFRVYCPFEGP